MLVKLNDTAYIGFSTRDPDTGAAADAVINSVTFYQDGVNLNILGGQYTVANPATGQYEVQVAVTIVRGFVIGKTVVVRVNATVGTVTDETVIGTFQVSAENHGTAIDKILSSMVTDITSYGDSGWTTATGFATPTDISNLQTHGDTNWATATTVGLTQAGVDSIWGEQFYGKAASEILAFAAAGAGAGVLDVGVTWDAASARTEQFTHVDGSTAAFNVTADKNGNRQSVAFP